MSAPHLLLLARTQWLRSVTTTRQSFNMLFGECPYCSKPMKVKITR